MVKVKEIRRFECKGMAGFSFSYPVFEGWEPGFAQPQKENCCVIFMQHPGGIEFEIAPQIRVSKLSPLVQAGKGTCRMNPQAVAYDFVYDPSLYVAGHKPEPGLWNYLEFYGKEFGVRIEIVSVSLEYGFSTEQFVQKVIETFRFQ